MFSRLFNINHKKDNSKKEIDDWKKDLDEFQSPPRLPKLEGNQIRVLIYKETSSKKTLLFDSDVVILVQEQEGSASTGNDKHEKNGKNKKQLATPVAHPPSPPKYQVTKPKADVKMFGEMIFGNLAMVYKGSIVKVHLIRNPPQLLMTKVFALRSRSAGVNFCDSEMSSVSSLSKPVNVSTPSLLNDSTSSDRSPVESISRSYSTPIGIKREPSSSLKCPSLLAVPSWSTSDLDSMSLSSSISLNASPLDSHTGSFRHRFYRSKRTSLDSSQLWRSRSEQSEELRTVYKQQPKIGVGVIFNLWDTSEENRAFQNFFFTHYTLFETHLQALRVKIEKSFYLRQKFLDTAVDAIECFRDDVFRLCYAPRIIEPVWLNLTSTVESKQRECSERFMKCFLDLYKTCESKESSYFLSNLLTAVLTHHLSWVNSVQSSEDKSSQKLHLDKYSSKAFNVLAKCHPYNPLWAQICDLYGCLGSPFKLARTVIVGKNVALVKQVLEFVSYFIRCCEVKENSVRMERQRDVLGNRQSGSNWGDSLCGSVGSQNSHIQSWFERSCNILSAPGNTVYDTSGNVDHFKDFKSYSHLDALKEENERDQELFDTDVMKIINSVNSDTTKCFCSVLQALNTINSSNNRLKSYIRMDDVKPMESKNQHSKRQQQLKGENDTETLKCCVLCRTLEKGMFEEFCDTCKLELGKINLDVSLVCLHCVERLDRLKTSLLGDNADKNLSSYPIRTSRSDSKFEKTVCQSKPSFICYCCSPSTYGNVQLDLHVEVTQDDSDDLSVTPRPRNTSDPVDFITKGENKFGNLRNSTNSHDSGTEMEYCSSGAGDTMSECCTRTNSLSSHGVAQDLDSDYCSIENEQLASTLTDVPSMATLVVPASQEGFINGVMKSSSTSTLKAPSITCNGESLSTLDDFDIERTSTICDASERPHTTASMISTDDIEQEQCEEQLVNDLRNLRLSEVTLPRSTNRLSRKSSAKMGQDALSLGKSMFAGYCEEYMPNFVLQGCRSLDKNKLAAELQKTVKYSVLDEEVADAVCIVADTDDCSCEVWGISRRLDSVNQNTCESLTTQNVYASDLVSSMVESTKELCGLNMPANFCLLHIEEQLRDLYNRSKVFSEYSQLSDEEAMFSFMRGFGYHRNDIDLLTAVGDAFVVPVGEDVSMTY